MSRHINIPIFIPHLGCPNDCVFCNQRSISGRLSFHEEKVSETIEEIISTLSEEDDAEIAFFGGSFTGIDRSLMIRLLDIANTYVKSKKVSSIRLSTRPDYIDEEILSILSSYPVKTIELGIQSMNERVLKAAKRGHSPKDSIKAAKAVVEHGFDLVGQMMVGLPMSEKEDELNTAIAIADMGAKFARVYPTVVFYDTELKKMTEDGIYRPLEISEAAERTAAVLYEFIKRDVNVIRVGLCSGENLESEDVVYGNTYHPAIGEIAESMLYRRLLEESFDLSKYSGKQLTAKVKSGNVSKIIGHKAINKNYLKDKYNISSFKVIEDINLSQFDIVIC